MPIDGNRKGQWGEHGALDQSGGVALPPFQAVYAGASGAIPGKLGETTEDQFDRVIGVNLGGTLLTVRKALPLIKDGGSIILKG